MRIGRPIYGGKFKAEGAEPLEFVLPGEVVEASPLKVLERSQQRVDPKCVHFGECGGCQYQHVEYEAQLGWKKEILEGIFAQAGLTGMPAIRSRSGQEYGYRNRIRLRMEGGRVGYSRRATNEFLPVVMCPIAAGVLWRAAEALMSLSSETALGRWLGAVSEVEFFCTANEARLQAMFFLRTAETARNEPQLFEAVCARLREAVPELLGAGAALDPELNRRVRRNANWAGAGWGADGLAYEAAGRSYWVGRGAFFQVNRFLMDGLVALVCDEAEGKLAWDLFAGVGLFTRALADRFGQVVAVEAGDAAAGALTIAAKGGRGAREFEAVHAPVLEFLRAREHQRGRPELVVLDPPRAGLGAEGAEVLARIGAEHVVYVSCDPVTLSRDLQILAQAYRVESVDLVDLFPQTFHMETVVKLRLIARTRSFAL